MMQTRLQSVHELLDQKDRRLAQRHEIARQFVDQVSHEFRTPLTVIKEYVAIIRDGLAGQVSQQQRQFLGIVGERADDLAILLDDMLDLTRLEAGLLRVWRKKSRIDDVFEQVRPALKRKAAIRNITLEISLEEDLPEVFCDTEKLGRVIVNLALRAIKFCGQGGSVKLSAARNLRAAEILIEVSEDGPGAAPKDLPPIFDRFEQLESDPHGSSKDCGLGLRVAKELVRLHFDRIDVESEQGRGTTFRFGIPLWDPAELLLRCLKCIEQLQDTAAYATLLTAEVEPTVEPGACNLIDEVLQQVFQGNDLVIQVPPHKWLIVTPCAEDEVTQVLDRVQVSCAQAKLDQLGESLPELSLRPIGTWSVETQTAEIVATFRRELPAAEQPIPAGACPR